MSTTCIKEYIKNIITINPTAGYIYCIHNEMYGFYGDNIYKLGMCKNIKKRLASYSTPYIAPCKLILSSAKNFNCNIAENILFLMLEKYRLKTNREFFQVNIDTVKNAFSEIENIMTKLNNLDSLSDDEVRDLYKYFSKINQTDELKKAIMNASDITDDMYNNMKLKQLLDSTDEFKIFRYEFRKFWKIDENHDNKLEKAINTCNMYYHYIKNPNYLRPIQIDNTLNEKIKYINDIISHLNFDLDNMNIKHDKDTFYKNVNNLLSESDFYKNKTFVKKVFNKPKACIKHNMKGSGLITMINSFLNDFNLEIRCKHKFKKEKIQKNQKNINKKEADGKKTNKKRKSVRITEYILANINKKE